MKSKKILTILLSLAIMFTFMPAMAFAATTVTVPAGKVATWSVDDLYATLTDDNNHPFKATRSYSDSQIWSTATDNWSGQVIATVANDDSEEGYVYTKPTEADGTALVDRRFYDLNGSSLVYGSSYKALDKSVWSKAAFDEALAAGEIYVKIIKQNYDATNTAYKAEQAGVKYVPLAPVTGKAGKYTATLYSDGSKATTVWTLNFDVTKYDSDKKTEDQTISFTWEAPTTSATIDGKSAATAELAGVVPGASVTIRKQEADKPDASHPEKALFMDTVDNTAGMTAMYDGAAHKIVAKEFAGYTVEFAIYNKNTGHYDPAPSGVTLTDAGTVQFSATFSNATTKDKVEMKGQIASVSDVNTYTGSWGFGYVVTSDEGNSSTHKYVSKNSVAGEEYNAADYLDVAAASPASKADYKQIAATAAVAANKTELMNFFNDFYEVKATTLKGHPNNVTLSIVSKTFTTAAEQKEETALKAKYEKLMSNFGLTATTGLVASNDNVVSEASVTLNSTGVDTEVVFTKAITSKTYKGSKTTKKGKLKKNQTIQFTAETPNGTAVKYKLMNVNTSKITINSTTGKVTLKKGLAKGTYKFKVKAYIPGDTTKMAYETQSVTIKVKK